MKTTSYRAWAKNLNTKQAITTDYLRRSAAIALGVGLPDAQANAPLQPTIPKNRLDKFMLKFNQRLATLAILSGISIISIMVIIANLSVFAPSSQSKSNFVYLQKTLIAY